MYIHYQSNRITINWKIFRGVSSVQEDFSRAKVAVFLFNGTNRYPAPCSIEDDDCPQGASNLMSRERVRHNGLLRVEVAEGLPEGVYDIEAVWSKNGGRSVSRSRVDNAFAVTADPESATDQGGAAGDAPTLWFASSAATYGYDGLSAYELAVLKGKVTQSEDEWVEAQLTVATAKVEAAGEAAVGEVEAAARSATSALAEATEEAVEEVETTTRQGVEAVETVRSRSVSAVEAAESNAIQVINKRQDNAEAEMVRKQEEVVEAAAAGMATAKQEAIKEVAESGGWSQIIKEGSGEADLEIADDHGNVLAVYAGGEFSVKHFNSATTPAVGGMSEADLDICDEEGNVLARFAGGGIRTKQFNSADIDLKEIEARLAFVSTVSACRYEGKLMHLSFDDTTACLTSLFSSLPASIYDITFFANLKWLHETYGACFSCYVFSSALVNVSGNYATEFQTAKSWLKWNFHALNATKTYAANDISEDYESCVAKLLTMCGGDAGCLDHQMRASYWELSLANAKSIRDSASHSTYILCAKDPVSPSTGNYYLTKEQEALVNANALLFDHENRMIFIKTAARIDSDAYVSQCKALIEGNMKWQKSCEVLNHENYFNLSRISSFLDWAKNTMGFRFGFFDDIYSL